MPQIHGTCPAEFEAVREALAALLDEHDVGASAAVFLEGEPVVDHGGLAQIGRGRQDA